MTRVDVKLKLSPGRQNIDTAAIDGLKYSPGIQADMRRRGGNVANYQRMMVGVKTGKLYGTIRVEDDRPGVTVWAGRAGQTPQLGYQMFGTSPHTILPKRAGGRLSFFWAKAGAFVSLPRVSHPGTKRNDFVQSSIAAAAS